MSIEVINKIEVYEKNGEDVTVGKVLSITVESHWNYPERVTIGFAGTKLTVLGDELVAAIKNAMNTERF